MKRWGILVLVVALVVVGFLLLRPKPASQAGGTLYFLNWADYIPEDLLKKFEAETGAKVVLDTFESPEAMLAKLKALRPMIRVERACTLGLTPSFTLEKM